MWSMILIAFWLGYVVRAVTDGDYWDHWDWERFPRLRRVVKAFWWTLVGAIIFGMIGAIFEGTLLKP